MGQGINKKEKIVKKIVSRNLNIVITVLVSFYSSCYNQTDNDLVVFITVTALLYKLVKDRLGRIRQTVTLKAKRVNVVILNDDHTNATTTSNRTKNWARQQHICQVEDSEAEESNEHVQNRMMAMTL